MTDHAVPQSAASVSRVLPMAICLFGGILYREILMDVNDIANDAAAGVTTLPVLLGRAGALYAAVALAAAGIASAAWAVRQQLPTSARAAAHMLGLHAGAVPCVYAVSLVLLTLNYICSAWSIRRRDFDTTVVDRAIATSYRPIGLGMIAFAALAAAF